MQSVGSFSGVRHRGECGSARKLNAMPSGTHSVILSPATAMPRMRVCRGRVRGAVQVYNFKFLKVVAFHSSPSQLKMVLAACGGYNLYSGSVLGSGFGFQEAFFSTGLWKGARTVISSMFVALSSMPLRPALKLCSTGVGEAKSYPGQVFWQDR